MKSIPLRCLCGPRRGITSGLFLYILPTFPVLLCQFIQVFSALRQQQRQTRPNARQTENLPPTATTATFRTTTITTFYPISIPSPSTMKFSLIVLTAALALAPGISGSPHPELTERAPCYHASDCSWFYAAKCEQYCRQWGQNVGVARMEKCSFLNNKRCCCTR